MARTGLCPLVLLTLLPSGVSRSQVIDEDFVEFDDTLWQLTGTAVYDDVTESVALTPPTSNQWGGLFYIAEPITLDNVTITFTAEISQGIGSDGMAMFIVAGDIPPDLCTFGGSTLGIINMPGPIFHVELDTYGGGGDWEGNGLAGNHIGVGYSDIGYLSATDTSPPTQANLSANPGFELENSGPITVEVEFDAGHVIVSVQGDPIIEGDLDNWAGPFEGLLGFSGACGGNYDRHGIHDVTVDAVIKKPCAKVKRSLPTTRFTADQEFEVTLTVSSVCGNEDSCTPPNAPETATIVETLPDGWVASVPTAPGVVGPGNVVTWTFTGGSFKPMDLTYKVLTDDRCTPARISGKVTCSGFSRDASIGGSGILQACCPFGPDGYIMQWLILGPIGDQGGCDIGPVEIQADYLTDGMETQETILPYDGMQIEIDFALAENAGEVYYGRTLDDIPVWYAICDNDGGIDYNDDHMLGMQNDNVMAYAICYVTNTTGEDIEDVYIGTGSDDALEVWFDDQVWTMDTCRGWGFPTPQEANGPVTLVAGVQHRIMTKTFEQGGGWNFYLRFQDATGFPITDGLEVSLNPFVPLRITRSLSSASYKPGDTVTGTLALSEVKDDPRPTAVKITETLPFGWTATNVSDGGTIQGRTIVWNLTGAAIANGKKITYQMAAPKGIAAVFTGVFAVEAERFDVKDEKDEKKVATTLPRAPIPEENLSPWIAADIGTPLKGGQEKISDNSFNIWGGGADISSRADSFRFIYQSTLGGDLTMWVRVEGQDATGAGAKAGLMVRQSLEPGSPFYFVQVTPSDGAGPRYRTSLNGNAGPALPISAEADLPLWLKLVRKSNSFTAFTSTDGSTWEQNFRTATHKNPRSLTLTEPVLYGFAVTAGDAAKVSGVMFRDFQCDGPGFPCGGDGNFFNRGDVDGSGSLTIGDAITLLNYQFAGGAKPPCLDACDTDDSGALTIGDPIYLLSYMFAGGPPPAAPGPPGSPCSPDTTGVALGCEAYPQAACR